jgi:signal peptidase II
VIAGLVVDLWTKAAVFSALRIGESLSIIEGILTFRPVLNDGAAFGIASGRQPLLVGVSLVATAVIIVIFLVGGMRRRIAQAALGLFVAGVCGNLWDRMFNDGCVRDFVDVVYWPGRHWNTFNVADALLCAAVGLLAIASFLTPSTPSQKPAPQQK